MNKVYILFKQQIIFCAIIIMTCNFVEAGWVLTSIENKSDLKFLQAARNNNVEIPSITKLLQVSQAHQISLPSDALFGSTGNCKIITQNQDGKQLSFIFYGDPTYRVASSRARDADIDSRNAASAVKQSLLARVFLEDGTNLKLVGFNGYEKDNQSFTMTIEGQKGNYTVALTMN